MTFIRRSFFKRSTRTRYGNEKIEIEGESFDSKLEAAVYQVLLLRQRAGEIVVEARQDQIYLTQASVEYRADFRCRWVASQIQFWVEAKGYPTPEWKIKKKLWGRYGPGELEIWEGSYKRPVQTGSVIPNKIKFVVEMTEEEYEKFLGIK